jgi:hypothetical protein
MPHQGTAVDGWHSQEEEVACTNGIEVLHQLCHLDGQKTKIAVIVTVYTKVAVQECIIESLGRVSSSYLHPREEPYVSGWAQ